MWNKERFDVALVKLCYPGLRSAVGKLMRNGLVEGSLAWKENTEGKVWSGEELGGRFLRKCSVPTATIL